MLLGVPEGGTSGSSPRYQDTTDMFPQIGCYLNAISYQRNSCFVIKVTIIDLMISFLFIIRFTVFCTMTNTVLKADNYSQVGNICWKAFQMLHQQDAARDPADVHTVYPYNIIIAITTNLNVIG